MKKLGDNAYPFIFVVSLPYHSVYGKILRVKAVFTRCKPFHGKKIVVFVFKLLRINEHAMHALILPQACMEKNY